MAAPGGTFSTLVAVDTSSEACHALLYFLDHFYKPGSKIILLHCIESSDLDKKLQTKTGSNKRPNVPFDNWMEKWEGGAKADKMIGQYKSLINDKYPSVTVTYEVEPTADVAQTIIDLAKHHNTVAVVVGSHGSSYAKARRKPDTIHGGITTILLQRSPIPIIVCRFQEDSGSNANSPYDQY